MLRRHVLAWAGAAPWLAGCGVAVTVADGPDAPSFEAPSHPFGLALVLAAGGPRGFAHVGVVRALAELDIRPDLIVGASVGALIGGAMAAGLPIERIEALAFDFDFYRLARWSPGSGLMMDGSRIAALVHESLGVRRFAELRVPLAVVATDQQALQPVVFNRGDLGWAVQASCAIPGRFAPVRVRGRDIVDADVASPLPVKAARALGARKVLAIDVAVHMDKPRPPGAERYLEGDRIKREQIDAEARLADLVLHPYFGYWVSLSREYRENTARAAYEQTIEKAALLRALTAA
ncbi:MAG TPA: patatin-like phospholipase family protein [Albitalea sp.]|uniref:patatin-like phospholipase family protein n=1 Tax=Piscinibacter sp. TaxID=1903157 RepID=UPI002ED1CCA2